MLSISVAIIDYGMGNLFSVKRACEHVGLSPVITSDRSFLKTADAAILPGVGAFGDAMGTLRKLDLLSPILDFVNSDKPFMGICLGMQLLMSESEEFGIHQGLDVFKGSVVRFPVKRHDGIITKVPQVGWNRIYRPLDSSAGHWASTPLSGVADGEYVYFVHSFCVVSHNREEISALSTYEGTEYCSAIQRKNVFACQFHPEKSADPGLNMYRNWATVVNNYKEGMRHV